MPQARSSYHRASVEHRLVKEMRLLGWHMPHTQGLVLLDIGIGDGSYLQSYLASGFRVIGLDNNQDSLCHLNSTPAHQEQRLYPIRGDANRLPLREGSVDIVFMCQLLEHLNDPTLALQEAYRVLRPGGWLFVDVPWWHEIYRPLSVFLLRQLQRFKAKGSPPPLLRAFLKLEGGHVKFRPVAIPLLRLVQLLPTFREIQPEQFIEDYIRGDRLECNMHLHFYLPSEWRDFEEKVGFKIKLVTGAWITPHPLNRLRLFNHIFGELETHLGDATLSKISQILIIMAIKPESSK